MLQIAVIRENQEKVITALAKKHLDAATIVEEILQLDENRRNTQVELDNTLSESNRLSKDIGDLMKNGEKAKAEILKLKTVSLREQGKELSEKVEAFAHELTQKMYLLAKLQRALISYFLDKNTDAGYQEYQVPHLVNEASGYGTGQLPDKEGQMYHVGLDDLYLIPTAEVPVTNIFRDVIVNESELPILCTGYTPCFRREAGSYGAHVRGLNRLHQFDKVEIVRIEHPDNSYQALDGMVEHVKNIMRELKLPFRILRLCGGDMSFASALTYDFEVFSTAQDRWLEISSVSNFETFQANRLKLRFKDKEGKNQLAHTLNGSSLALPRVMAGILENYQTPEGIVIPEVLRKYTGFDIIN